VRNFIRKIVATIHRLWSIPFLRFLVVGAVNTVVGYSIFAVCILLNFHYAIATALSVFMGTLFNFKVQSIVVFKNKNNWLIFRFFLVSVIYYLLNTGLLKLFIIYNFNKLVAQAIIILPLAIVSFLLMRKFVFRRQNNSTSK
jgi:putative flippase GtrA